MRKPFIKMHGLGNDFVILDSRKNKYILNEESIKLISNRRLGVGCDQIIEITDSNNYILNSFKQKPLHLLFEEKIKF